MILRIMQFNFLGVPACFAAQSACYGLRYRFGAVAPCVQARMPSACLTQKNGFLRGRGLRPRPRSSCFIPLKKNVLQGKTTFFTLLSREG